MIQFRDGQWQLTGRPADERLTDRLPAFVPGWTPGEQGPGKAILAVAARFAEVIADRLTRAPDKLRLAFLDALGVAPIPARPATGPVVFELSPGAVHGFTPAGTRLGGPPDPSDGNPIPFETTDPIALAASRLVEVKAALPGDLYSDHTSGVLGDREFTLFDGLRPVPRELYLGHDRLFAFNPGGSVELQIELAADSGSLPPGATVDWTYWDGEAWVEFARFARPDDRDPEQFSRDGTAPSKPEGGLTLTRSGKITLRAGERPAAPLPLRGVTAYWVRGALRMPPPDPNKPAPLTDTTSPLLERVRAVVRQQVSGFRLASRVENVVGKNGRELRLRLVDDSGGPLDVGDPSDPRYFVFDRRSGKKIDRDPTKSTDFLIRGGNEGGLDLLIAPVDFKADGTPNKKASVWDVSPINDLRPDRSYEFDLARGGRLPELVFANGQVADPSATFLPFGPQPIPGAVLLFACAEVTAKPGARVTLFTEVESAGTTDAPNPPPAAAWEYWNGLVWAPLPRLEGEPDVLTFRKSGDVAFTVPVNVSVKKEFAQEKAWVRVRLTGGGYLVKKGGEASADDKAVKFDKVFPPAVRRFRIGYQYESSPEPPTAALSYDEFRWRDVSDRVKVGGRPFAPFKPPIDVRPTLYLGFTRPLPTARISLFVDVTAEPGVGESEVSWEFADIDGGPPLQFEEGDTRDHWRPLQLDRDDTRGLRSPGYVRFTWPGFTRADADPAPVAGYAITGGRPTLTFTDARGAAKFRPGDAVAVFQDDAAELGRVKAVEGAAVVLDAPLQGQFAAPLVAFAPPARFGSPRYWVRVVWASDPGRVVVRGLYLNAVRAEQVQTQTDERLGGTTGVGGEVFDFARTPVLDGEEVWVQELAGGRADAEWPVLERELDDAGLPHASHLKVDRDPRTHKATAAWVRWVGVSTFAQSGPRHRHYTVERVRGRVQFGDGRFGMVPPSLPNNLKATYRAGGGKRGNLAAGAVASLLGSVPGVQRVFNPRATGGGADGELTAGAEGDRLTGARRAILDRGPQAVRHRGRAVAAADYEQLARLASPSVAVARAVVAGRSAGVVPAGTVRVVVVPHADPSDPAPIPGPVLTEQVQTYLQARAPAGVRVEVTRPEYLPIGVEAVLVPRDPAEGGQLSRRAKTVLATFLHPVGGGPDGRGWGFGRAVYRSDVVAVLRNRLADALAYSSDVRLTVDGVGQPEQVDVPADRLPSAGTIRVLLAAPGGCP